VFVAIGQCICDSKALLAGQTLGKRISKQGIRSLCLARPKVGDPASSVGYISNQWLCVTHSLKQSGWSDVLDAGTVC
jgi:hypothetical protein